MADMHAVYTVISYNRVQLNASTRVELMLSPCAPLCAVLPHRIEGGIFIMHRIMCGIFTPLCTHVHVTKLLMKITTPSFPHGHAPFSAHMKIRLCAHVRKSINSTLVSTLLCTRLYTCTCSYRESSNFIYICFC